MRTQGLVDGAIGLLEEVDDQHSRLTSAPSVHNHGCQSVFTTSSSKSQWARVGARGVEAPLGVGAGTSGGSHSGRRQRFLSRKGSRSMSATGCDTGTPVSAEEWGGGAYPRFTLYLPAAILPTSTVRCIPTSHPTLTSASSLFHASTPFPPLPLF